MSFEEQVLAALGEIKQSINRLEARVENIETRLDRIEVRVENLENRLDRIEARVENLEKRLGNLEERVEIVEGQTAENTAILRALEHRVEESSSRIEEMSINMNKEFGLLRAEMNKKFQEIDDKFGGVYKVLGEHAVKLAM